MMVDSIQIRRFQPSMAVIAETFDALGWPYRADCHKNGPGFSGVRLFSGQRTLEEDCVYIVRPEDIGAFPSHRYACLCTSPVSGEAEHICCPQRSPEELLDCLLGLFQRYREWERQLDGLVLSGGSLDELCRWGRQLLDKPVMIHDPWFIVLAMSDGLPREMQPETVAESAMGYIPHKYIDSFRNDTDYLRTRTEKKAGLWVSKDGPGRCIYANLWDDGEYQGRLLVLEETPSPQASHLLAAECLAQRAMLILKRGRAEEKWGYHSLDDIMYAFLTGQALDITDGRILLTTLQWKRPDRYQCIRLQDQRTEAAAAHRQMIHSDLFRLFPESYVMFIRRQQCVVLNLDRRPYAADEICRRLEGICRDYVLYAGFSAPVQGIDGVRHAFRQAGIALETACRRKGKRWVVPFSICALEHMLQNIRTELPPEYLAASELLALLEYDRRNGTAYFQTLRTYLVNERSMPQSAQQLIIHRTTLIYRLKKIQEVTGLDLEDPDQRLYLLLSFRILEQMGIVPGEEEVQAEIDL